MDKDGYHGYDKEEQDPDELTMAYLSGVHDGKKQRTWVGLTIEEIQDLIKHKEHSPFALAEEIEAKLKEKNA